jgi:hypothetical protein
MRSARASRAGRRALALANVRTKAFKFMKQFRAHEPTTRASLAAPKAGALPNLQRNLRVTIHFSPHI